MATDNTDRTGNTDRIENTDRTGDATRADRTFSLPNLLTFGRLAAVLVVAVCLAIPDPYARALALVLFVAAAVTDWLDGFLARRMGQGSDLGRMLDPIADKLLVAAALVMLVEDRSIPSIHALAAVLIIGREVFISGVREFLGTRGVTLHVTGLAKWKTTLQLLAIAILIFAPLATTRGWGWGWIFWWLGVTLIWLAAALTVYTGWLYLQKALPSLTGRAL